MTSVTRKRTAELMTPKAIVIAVSETLRAAARVMIDAKIHALYINPAEPGDSVGVITLKDIVQILAHENEDALEDMIVEDVMTKPAITLPHDMSVRDALRLLRMTGIRRAPVVQDGEIAGVFSYTDVLRALE